MGKTIDHIYDLLEEMVSHNYQWPMEITTKKAVGVYEIDGFLYKKIRLVLYLVNWILSLSMLFNLCMYVIYVEAHM